MRYNTKYFKQRKETRKQVLKLRKQRTHPISKLASSKEIANLLSVRYPEIYSELKLDIMCYNVIKCEVDDDDK